MKYLIIREPDGGEHPHFCVAPVTHQELLLTLQHHRPGRTCVGAGFVDFRTGLDGQLEARTFGRSESVGLGPRDHDSRIIEAMVRATLNSARQFAVAAPDPVP